MKQWKLLTAAVLVMMLLLSACAGDPDTSSVSPAPSESESSSTVTDAGDTSAQPDESQPAGDEGAASTPDVEGEPEKEPEPTPEQTPDAQPEKEPEAEPAPEVTPTPEVTPVPEVTPAPEASETVEPAPEHKHAYKDTVVAPTTSEKGYTLHTCSVCGDSYKDNYTDKLPAEKPGKDEYVNDGGESNTVEESAGFVAGKMVSGEKAEYRPAPNPNADKNTAVEELNELAFFAYGGFRFFDDGIAKNYEDEGRIAKFVTHSDGRTGINVFGWRKGYDSSEITNFGLNLVLEAFYYMTGDRQVAKALWDVVDYMSINGAAATTVSVVEGFGFTCSNETSNGIDLSMNGVHIRWEWGGGNYFYFG